MSTRSFVIGIALCILPLSMASADEIAAESIVVPAVLVDHARIEFADTGMCVELALVDLFAPAVAAGPPIQLAPIDPDRKQFFAAPRIASGAIAVESEPVPPICSPLRGCNM